MKYCRLRWDASCRHSAGAVPDQSGQDSSLAGDGGTRLPPDGLFTSSVASPSGFAEARAAADRAEAVTRSRAALTVAGHSRDSLDCHELLRMLGLAEPEHARRR
ncbi:hypothetical protein Lesp02_15130 [Lentzea sp. NBRC 105346]|nr:hypothetical protein Lesp02_15130 [Lentzea sp. NBRC 105346]